MPTTTPDIPLPAGAESHGHLAAQPAAAVNSGRRARRPAPRELLFPGCTERLWLGPSSMRTLLGALVAAQVAAL